VEQPAQPARSHPPRQPWRPVCTGVSCTCTYLYLNNKGIAKIANDTVSDMPNLRTLKLDGNDITELEPGAASNLPSLLELYLSNNKIAKLQPGTVSGVSNLQYLYLDGNDITELEPGAVSNLPGLLTLVIYDNPMCFGASVVAAVDQV